MQVKQVAVVVVVVDDDDSTTTSVGTMASQVKRNEEKVRVRRTFGGDRHNKTDLEWVKQTQKERPIKHEVYEE